MERLPTVRAGTDSRHSHLNSLAKLARRDDDGVPVVYDATDRLAAKIVAWRGDNGEIGTIRKLTDDEISAAQSRDAALTLAIMPHGDDDARLIEATLAAMFGGFRQMTQSNEADAESMIKVTRAVLKDFPAWAIERACVKIAKANAGLGNTWPPSDAEIVALVRKEVAPYIVALRTAKGLLASVPRDELPRLSVEQLKQKYGDWKERWRAPGVGETSQEASRKQARSDLAAKIGQEAFDAIPDAPERR